MSDRSVSLAKAMMVKNRLAGRLTEAQSRVQTYNTITEGRRDECNVEEAYAQYCLLQDAIIGLKSAISAATQPVQPLIYERDEKKGKIAFLKVIPTTNGTVPGSTYQPEVKWVAYLKKADIDREVKKLEGEVDTLQEKMNAFNAITQVRVNQGWLDLAS